MTTAGHIFTTLDIDFGDLDSPIDMAIRPGTFAPLSTITIPDELIALAGESIELQLTLRDVRNSPITSSLPDPNRFTCFAVGEVDVGGQVIEVTFPQEVTRNEADSFFTSATLKTTGTFELHIREGTTGIQTSFQNSPITLTITPAAHDRGPRQN